MGKKMMLVLGAVLTLSASACGATAPRAVLPPHISVILDNPNIATADASFTVTGTTVAGALVHITAGASATADSAGKFGVTVTNVPEGTSAYNLTAEAPTFQSTTVMVTVKRTIATTTAPPPPKIIVQVPKVSSSSSGESGFSSAIANGEGCHWLASHGYTFSQATQAWIAKGRPASMDADHNGIPCEQAY